jgi:flagellar basal body-associated protein FliL
MEYLTIITQVLIIVVLVLVVAVLGYVMSMLQKVNKKLDTLLEIVTYYEKLREVVIDFANGPGKMYIEIAQSVFSFVVPMLTNKRNSK